MKIDKTGLDDRIIDVFLNSTNERGYLFVTNMDTKVTRWSNNAVAYFQMPGEYVLDMDSFWDPRIHPDDLKDYKQKLHNVLSGRHEWEYFEYRIRNIIWLFNNSVSDRIIYILNICTNKWIFIRLYITE